MKISLRKDIDLRDEHINGWLLSEKAYIVLSVEQYSSDEIGFRLASEDSGQPVLFRASLFDVIDNSLPRSWKILALRGGALDLGPEAFGQVGFWERCFDRDPVALDDYQRAKDQIVADS